MSGRLKRRIKKHRSGHYFQMRRERELQFEAKYKALHNINLSSSDDEEPTPRKIDTMFTESKAPVGDAIATDEVEVNSAAVGDDSNAMADRFGDGVFGLSESEVAAELMREHIHYTRAAETKLHLSHELR